jgi:hypothetical protein
MADFGMTEPPHATGGRLWRLELIATLLLGLSAVGAGWTAYQAARWSSDQTFTLDRANRVRRQATLLQNKANLLRVVDVGMFIGYAQAVSQGNNLLANFLLERFRPPMKAAVRAWIATKPLKNPDAPPSPFVMKEYRLQEEVDVHRLEEEAEQALGEARRENRTADNYILVTVPFAIVSLFSGLSTKFMLPGIRTAIVAMAFTIFVGAVVVLFFMPVR